MRYAKHFSKDLYSARHRDFDGIAMVDIDSVEICKNWGCWKPLAIVETVYDTGNYVKYTTVSEYIARELNIPCFLVFYKKGLGQGLFYKIKQIYPFKRRLRPVSERVWITYLRKLQAEHQVVCKHGRK
tara:strand:- start:627 stop:1010 length:384 start_codon:yes stop_codon:yes gene_type:complete